MRKAWRRTTLAMLAAGFTASAAGFVDNTVGRIRSGGEEAVGAVRFLDPLLHQRVLGLTHRSATWRAGLDSLRATGFRVVVASPEQVRAELPGMASYDALHLGEVVPLRDAEGGIVGAVVTIDLPRLRALAAQARVREEVLLGDVDRILIHEIYGHVLPLAETRRISGGCPDPGPSDPPTSSCAIVRENRIRVELGLPERLTYDLRGLALGAALEGGTRR
jgi:hypothetical protein